MPVYEVGMGSDRRTIEAPSAGAAAMYYGIFLVTTNNPFLVAVYTVDGQKYDGEQWWMNFNPTEEFVHQTFDTIGIDNIKNAKVIV